MPLPRLLILPALAALFALAATGSPASAQNGVCPCWPDGVPSQSPLVCYASPGPATNTFAYIPPFLQATDFWCRNNAGFAWTSAAEREACDLSLRCLCGERFIDRGATVYDCQEKLEWEKKTAANVNTTYTWSANFDGPTGTIFTTFLPAVATALGGTACHHTTWSCSAGGSVPTDSPTCTPTAPPDGCWRLPEINELMTILSPRFPDCTSPPCIDAAFGPTASAYYWSATSLNSDPFNAWVEWFKNGFETIRSFQQHHHVRAVRSGP